MKNSEELTRLKRVLLYDSVRIPSGVVAVLKNDLTGVLSSYFELSEEAKVDVTVNENGTYDVTLKANAKSVKQVKSL